MLERCQLCDMRITGAEADEAAEIVGEGCETMCPVCAESLAGVPVDDDVCGNRVQVDLSGGQDHCWCTISREDIPADVVLELEGEMIDGGKDSCDSFVASNGQHYRW